MATIRLKRAYEPVSPEDGIRVLVDRLWPRGLSRAKSAIDHWMKEVAPSSELRRWFNHDPERWQAFRKKYEAELAKNSEALGPLRALVRKGRVTLVYGAKDEEHNHALVLKGALETKKRQ